MKNDTSMTVPRPARLQDASACAAIMNNWIDESDWLPRSRKPEEIEARYKNFVFKERRIWVIGDPVAGYLVLDTDEAEVTSLFVSQRGNGLGRMLLDQAKTVRDDLELWTFVANEGARHFYAREGFKEVRRTGGENEEGLPDILFRWEAA